MGRSHGADLPSSRESHRPTPRWSRNPPRGCFVRSATLPGSVSTAPSHGTGCSEGRFLRHESGWASGSDPRTYSDCRSRRRRSGRAGRWGRPSGGTGCSIRFQSGCDPSSVFPIVPAKGGRRIGSRVRSTVLMVTVLPLSEDRPSPVAGSCQKDYSMPASRRHMVWFPRPAGQRIGAYEYRCLSFFLALRRLPGGR